MDDVIQLKKNYADFVTKLTKTKTRTYIHIPAHMVKFKQVDPDKTYRVILIEVDQ